MTRPRCTQEAIARAVRLKKSGALDKDIAAAIGVRADTFSTWLNHPKSENQAQLSQELKKAEAEYYAALEGVIAKAARDRDWKAAAWLLERKRPERYARRTYQAERPAGEASDAPTIVLGVEPGRCDG